MAGEGRISNSILLERIEALMASMAEIKNEIKEHNASQVQFTIDYEKRHAILESNVKINREDIDDQDKDLRELKSNFSNIKSIVDRLVTQAKIEIWIGAAIGSSVIILIWSIIIGKVTLIFN